MNFLIYKTTLIYLALYYKKLANPSEPAIVTEDEVNNYINLVLKNLKEEQSIANAFSYTIVNSGEPTYNLNMATQNMKDLLTTAKFGYDPKTKVFYSYASEKALSLKSTFAYPRPIGHTKQPEGYEKVLHIKFSENKSEKNL